MKTKDKVVAFGGAHAAGKSIAVLQEFIARGKKGDAVVYSTPEGQFMSPEAVRRTVAAAKRRVAQRIRAVIEEAPCKTMKEDLAYLASRLEKAK